MTGWRVDSLDKLTLEILDGDWVETKDQGGTDYRLLQVSNIGLGRFRETGKFRYVTEKTFKRLRCTEISPGMVLVARMPDPVGRAWFVDRLETPAITAVDVAIIKPDPEFLDGRFCSYALNSPTQLSQWAASAGGTTRMRITRKQLAAMKLTLPDLSTQRRISGVLGLLDDLIHINQRQIDMLEQMTQEIYREWFVRFRYPGHEHIALVDSSIGPIPDGWGVSPCGEVLTVLGGGTPSKVVPDYWVGGTIPWYTPSDLTKGGHHRFTAQPALNITEAGLHGSSARLFPAGSVLMTSRATLGVLAIATAQAACNQGFIIIPPDDRWSPTYIYEWLSQHAVELEAIGTGATFKEITKGAFKRFPFLVPIPRVLALFEAAISPLDETTRLLEERTRNLTALRDLLLPRLVSGQIDVSKLDLGAVVEQM